MKLKSHHRKTLEDGIEIILCIGVHRYNVSITKIMDKNRYDIGIEDGNEQGYMWFENIKEFYSWDNVVKFFDSLI